jgi:protocatechuate 3,4-dioxygenase beta subunit
MMVKEHLKDLSLPAFGESIIGKFDNDLTKMQEKIMTQLGSE